MTGSLKLNAWATALAVLLASAVAAGAQSAIEYKTVAEAKSALLAKPGAESKLQDGWLVITDNGGDVIWSFTPEGHEAHPAVAKRILLQGEDGSFRVQTLLHCEASKEACDRLYQSFVALDAAMMKELEKPKQ